MGSFLGRFSNFIVYSGLLYSFKSSSCKRYCKPLCKRFKINATCNYNSYTCMVFGFSNWRPWNWNIPFIINPKQLASSNFTCNTFPIIRIHGIFNRYFMGYFWNYAPYCSSYGSWTWNA